MIPKIIHYVWFSEPMSDEVKQRLQRWQEKNTDYEIRRWGKEDVKNLNVPFLIEALEDKKWAPAADYVRLYAVYNYGGIYLDSDVELLRSFDEFLDQACFIGKETSLWISGPKQEQYLTGHCFGAEKDNSYIKRCLDFYHSIVFRRHPDLTYSWGLKYNAILLPFAMSEIAKEWGYDPKPLTQTIQKLDGLTIYPSWYFDMDKRKPESVAIHLALGSWRESRISQPTYNLAYKINWRIRAVFEKVASWFGYKLIKLK